MYDDCLLESGASNLFFVVKNGDEVEFVTHPLDGSILPGITRDSIIKLFKDVYPGDNFKMNERKFTMTEFMDRHEKGELVECFVSGTAAVIGNVTEINMKGKTFKLKKNKDKILSDQMKTYIE